MNQGLTCVGTAERAVTRAPSGPSQDPGGRPRLVCLSRAAGGARDRLMAATGQPHLMQVERGGGRLPGETPEPRTPHPLLSAQ